MKKESTKTNKVKTHELSHNEQQYKQADFQQVVVVSCRVRQVALHHVALFFSGWTARHTDKSSQNEVEGWTLAIHMYIYNIKYIYIYIRVHMIVTVVMT